MADIADDLSLAVSQQRLQRAKPARRAVDAPCWLLDDGRLAIGEECVLIGLERFCDLLRVELGIGMPDNRGGGRCPHEPRRGIVGGEEPARSIFGENKVRQRVDHGAVQIVLARALLESTQCILPSSLGQLARGRVDVHDQQPILPVELDPCRPHHEPTLFGWGMAWILDHEIRPAGGCGAHAVRNRRRYRCVGASYPVADLEVILSHATKVICWPLAAAYSRHARLTRTMRPAVSSSAIFARKLSSRRPAAASISTIQDCSR